MNSGNFFLILIGRCVQYVIYVYFTILLLVAGNTRFNIRLWSLLFSWITARSLHFNCHIHDNTIYFEIVWNYGYSRDWIFYWFPTFSGYYGLLQSTLQLQRCNPQELHEFKSGIERYETEFNGIEPGYNKKLKLIPNNNNNRIY